MIDPITDSLAGLAFAITASFVTALIVRAILIRKHY